MNLRFRLPATRSLFPALCALALLPACRADESKTGLDLQLDSSPLRAPAANARAVSYADVISPVQPAVVSVYSSKIVRERLQIPEFFRQFYGQGGFPERESRQEGLGSGVIVSKNGYILTNNHVVEEADELRVSLNDGRELEARLIGADPKTDVAVIKVDATDLPVATLADSDLLRVGDLVFAIGNPLGVGQTVTMGIVSATGRQVGILANEQTAGYESFIQTDAAINQGNSGGALVDAQGRLIGINSAILSGGRGGGNIGIGFAIPVNLASSILTSLVETGTVQRGYLGVHIDELKPDVAEALGLKRDQRGVIITNLPKDSPAAKSGLRRSDVIIAVDDRSVATPQELRFTIAAKLPGSKVDLKILRDGKERTVNVELGKLAAAESASEILPGVGVKPLDDETRRQVGAPKDLSGLVITEVAENSPHASRLTPGMVVVEVNREPVADLEDARRLLRPGRNLLIIYVRGMFTPVAVSIK
jgi:serine protease Do/serine protease DegQ